MYLIVRSSLEDGCVRLDGRPIGAVRYLNGNVGDVKLHDKGCPERRGSIGLHFGANVSRRVVRSNDCSLVLPRELDLASRLRDGSPVVRNGGTSLGELQQVTNGCERMSKRT